MYILVLPEQRPNVNAASTRSFTPHDAGVLCTFAFSPLRTIAFVHPVATHFDIALMPPQCSLCFTATFSYIPQEHFDTTYSYKMPICSHRTWQNTPRFSKVHQFIILIDLSSSIYSLPHQTRMVLAASNDIGVSFPISPCTPKVSVFNVRG